MNAVERELQAFIRSEADGVKPPDGAKERGWARLQAALAGGDGGPGDGDGPGGGGVAAPPVPPASALKAVPLLKVVPLIALVVVGVLVGWGVGREPAVVTGDVAPTPEPSSSPASAIHIPFVPPPVAAPPTIGPEPPPIDATDPVGSIASPVAPATTRPSIPRSRPAGGEDDFAGELKLLAAGQAAILRGDLREGLRLLKRHRQDYPRGQLAQERDALLAIARCEAGQASAAEAGRRFLRDNADSVHADRVRTACKL